YRDRRVFVRRGRIVQGNWRVVDSRHRDRDRCRGAGGTVGDRLGGGGGVVGVVVGGGGRGAYGVGDNRAVRALGERRDVGRHERVIHVRVVGQDIIRRDRRIFIRRGRIVHGRRRVVDRVYSDVNRRRGRIAGVIRHRVGERVVAAEVQ